jgi:nitroimidazol reductase NimA-like FMN-containing flavoprotein (pyridoxamine 5'-phosphate oxidase superfamily)
MVSQGENAMDALKPTPRTTLARRPNRGSYDRELIHAILDEALICHVGFAVDGQPYTLPTTHARVGELLYLHGSVASRMLRSIQTGAPICVTVTLIDGVVLARSALHHSMNYRSVVILGKSTLVDGEEKRRALEFIIEHVVPGRVADIRAPNEQELQATTVVSIPITEASAKVRTGPPLDLESDEGANCWAGVIPMSLVAGHPEPCPKLSPDIPVPPAVASYKRGPAQSKG